MLVKKGNARSCSTRINVGTSVVVGFAPKVGYDVDRSQIDWTRFDSRLTSSYAFFSFSVYHIAAGFSILLVQISVELRSTALYSLLATFIRHSIFFSPVHF